ncbi:hypothetical protein CPter291_0379 [Collimonas pratensis]|uniref:Uncharacterized protein n=1 Tax=Collimonas pratensis TaxID=279113 RepID=A0ABM5Z0X3_9BURK|nr:hypothetical protein CPter291_0379 [Collimonas pratensis]
MRPRRGTIVAGAGGPEGGRLWRRLGCGSLRLGRLFGGFRCRLGLARLGRTRLRRCGWQRFERPLRNRIDRLAGRIARFSVGHIC